MTTYPIGTTYTNRKGQTCTVTDVWTTTDSSGEVVRIRYVTVHQFCGQWVAESDVVPVTIAKGNPQIPTRLEA